MPGSPAGVDLAEALTAVARRLHETPTPDSTLDTAVRLAVDLVPGAEHAGISLIERNDRRRTLAWTDEVVRAAEDGHPTGEHRPYWQRLWTAPVAEVADSEGDEGEEALAELGLRSVLSLRLRADRRRLTVLTAYARKPRAFDETALRIGRLFTAHVGIALESATVREQLTEAMRTRDLIGQATGILMERLDIDAAGAFDSLVKASQRENVKLRDLALRIVDAHSPPDAR
ncbi:ANTAR domain-containing protein [Streptomyces griseomycini]|uniref:GAF domain-containing protein n=1 Tax=Streptomyces griseomycini TaxID=66895 RepID=A0A7W7LWL6_9ACTN|nr:ANTAR domain-containing protein [Streptomyces griseomycini]MBB4897825.1 GAF domain-containing protein [Streptomyces griseomycini]GGQ32051.1 transcription antitermination regulator [Streptomyces griseomycini]GGR48381.1 transcription antitermination regulator [Streptomyces griseomycini]